MDEREAFECGGFDAALKRLPPILMSKLNSFPLTTPAPR
jgi:hypothetical protein